MSKAQGERNEHRLVHLHHWFSELDVDLSAWVDQGEADHMTDPLISTAAIVITVCLVGIRLVLWWHDRQVERGVEWEVSGLTQRELWGEPELYDQDADELVSQINAQTFHRRTMTPEEWIESAKRVRVHIKRAGKGRG